MLDIWSVKTPGTQSVCHLLHWSGGILCLWSFWIIHKALVGCFHVLVDWGLGPRSGVASFSHASLIRRHLQLFPRTSDVSGVHLIGFINDKIIDCWRVGFRFSGFQSLRSRGDLAEHKGLTIAKPYHALAVLLFIVVYAVIFYNQSGLRPTLIVCGSMMVGFVLWMKTTFRTPIDSEKVIPIYLMTLTLFFVYIAEEFITDFPGAINSVFGSSWTMGNFVFSSL